MSEKPTARTLVPNKDSGVALVFESYPKEIRRKLIALRQLIFDVAADTPDIGEMTETLKWGEPAYLVEGGSTVRIGWKATNPDHYAMYFNCNSTLVDTFKELYADSFTYDGNRAIVFHRDDSISPKALAHCIALAFEYHKRKHLPLLGA